MAVPVLRPCPRYPRNSKDSFARGIIITGEIFKQENRQESNGPSMEISWIKVGLKGRGAVACLSFVADSHNRGFCILLGTGQLVQLVREKTTYSVT